MSQKAHSRFQNLLLVLGITLTLALSGFCWSKVLYRQSEIQVTSLKSAKTAATAGKKVVFLGGIFLGISKYLTSEK